MRKKEPGREREKEMCDNILEQMISRGLVYPVISHPQTSWLAILVAVLQRDDGSRVEEGWANHGQMNQAAVATSASCTHAEHHWFIQVQIALEGPREGGRA